MPVFPLNNFGGIHQRKLNQSNLVRRATNVLFENGRVIGRAGMEKLLGITTALNAGIIGFAEYKTAVSATITLIAFTGTKAYALNTLTNAWDDITGTALTAGIYNNISWTFHKDVLVFTNEVDAPRRWAGTGNTAVLGGSPPICSLVKHFEGYLFLGDVTIGGTRFPSRIRYSNDYNVTWTSTDEINLTETSGSLESWDTIGRTLYNYKSDGIVGIRFLGGQVRFSQFKIPFYEGIGIVAPASLTSIPGVGHVFLGTDLNLYLNNDESIKMMPPTVQSTLQEVPSGWIQYSSAVLDAKNHKWNLFVSSGDSWLGRRIIWDYQGDRWSIYDYPSSKRFARVFAATNRVGGDIWTGDSQLWSADSEDWSRSVVADSQLLIGGGSDKLVYKLDWDTTDDGVFIEREFETDWQDLGTRTRKVLYGIDLIFERAVGAEVYVSIATDFKGGFVQEKVFSLTGDENSDDVIVPYRITPASGVMFNVKLSFRHNRFTSTSPELATLKELYFFYDLAIVDQQARAPVWAV